MLIPSARIAYPSLPLLKPSPSPSLSHFRTMLLFGTFLMRPLADRVSRGFRARGRNSARQSQEDEAEIDSFRPENRRCTISMLMIANSCASTFSVKRGERQGISRRMEVVVISFGLWPMFDVTCHPRAVPTRNVRIANANSKGVPSPLVFISSLLYARINNVHFWGMCE